MPLFYERVYRARSIGHLLHGALVELVRATHQSPQGREIVGATFVLLQPTHGLLVANKFKLSARLIYTRLFSEFVGIDFKDFSTRILTAPSDGVTVMTTATNDLNFVVRHDALNLIVRPCRSKFSKLPYDFAVYATLLVLVARTVKLRLGDLIIAPLATQVSIDEMGELFNAVAPLVPWRGAELPLTSASLRGLTELGSGEAKRMLESRDLGDSSMFGWAPIIAGLNNSPYVHRNETLDNLLAEGNVLAWPLD